jgi:hypothetical protein
MALDEDAPRTVLGYFTLAMASVPRRGSAIRRPGHTKFSVGFNDKFWFDYLGHPHTEKLHTVEWYTRTDLGTMTIEATIDDPGAYARPFTTRGIARLQPASDEILEYICQETTST